jgi:uncharacterized damage-inducible protein DinB
MEDIQYPIGRFKPEPDLNPQQRAACVRDIAEMPEKLRLALAGLSSSQLDTPYREGGWTVRQVAHHLADSHLNAFCRFKLALTEQHPTIKPYSQDAWAATADSLRADPRDSVQILAGLHARWSALLSAMAPEDFARTFQHPESGSRTLLSLLQLYAWHGRHHVAQVQALRERKGWR